MIPGSNPGRDLPSSRDQIRVEEEEQSKNRKERKKRKEEKKGRKDEVLKCIQLLIYLASLVHILAWLVDIFM